MTNFLLLLKYFFWSVLCTLLQVVFLSVTKLLLEYNFRVLFTPLDLVITEWILLASTSMASFEEGPGTGRKIRYLNFCSSSFTYLLQHVRRTLRNILACFWILLLTWNLIYMWSEDDGTLLTCQPTTRSHAHRFTKVKSRNSSHVLVLNVGLLHTLQKFRSALTQYASKSSPRGFISEDSHIVWCAFASVPTIVGICSFSVKTNRSLNKLGGAGSSAAMYADTKTKLSSFRHTLLTLIATIFSFENIGIREQQRSGVA